MLPVNGVRAVEYLRQSNPNIFLMIVRSNNDNVIVYEQPLNQPIRYYWHDCDTKYQHKLRKQKKQTDVVEFNTMDRMAYGIKVVSQYADRTILKFNKFDTPIEIKSTPNGRQAFLIGTERQIRYIYIQVKFILGVPSVSKVTAHCYVGNHRQTFELKN